MRPHIQFRLVAATLRALDAGLNRYRVDSASGYSRRRESTPRSGAIR
ncbi:hypothetical protein [Sinorhizobium fredii]